MAEAVYWSIDGGALQLAGDGVDAWPAARSAAALRGHMGQALLESSSASSLRMLLTQFDGLREAEVYDHTDGTVTLMQGQLYGQRDFAYFGEQYVLLWESGAVGLVVKAEGRSREWFTDLAGLIRFEANERSARVAPTDPLDWDFEALPTPGLRLLVTIPDIGVARVQPSAEAGQPVRGDRSMSVPAGTLHTFDGERQDKVVLEAPSARLEVTLLEAAVNDAAGVLASLDSVAWHE